MRLHIIYLKSVLVYKLFTFFCNLCHKLANKHSKLVKEYEELSVPDGFKNLPCAVLDASEEQIGENK